MKMRNIILAIVVILAMFLSVGCEIDDSQTTREKEAAISENRPKTLH